MNTILSIFSTRPFLYLLLLKLSYDFYNFIYAYDDMILHLILKLLFTFIKIISPVNKILVENIYKNLNLQTIPIMMSFILLGFIFLLFKNNLDILPALIGKFDL